MLKDDGRRAVDRTQRDAKEIRDADVDGHPYAAHRTAQHDMIARDLDMTQTAIGPRVAPLRMSLLA